ncbi:MAG: hypothetical protein U0704_11315 [Candidatus Eisenbacteria bacterium]
MTKRSMTSLAAIATLLAAGVAVASDTPAPKPAAGQDREVHRVVVTTDGAEGGDFDEFAWLEGDDDVFFDGAGEEGGAPGQPGERKVIVRRIGGGPGMGGHGAGHGAGMGQCDDADCDGQCGMHGGHGHGPRRSRWSGHGHGPRSRHGMGRGMGMDVAWACAVVRAWDVAPATWR